MDSGLVTYRELLLKAAKRCDVLIEHTPWWNEAIAERGHIVSDWLREEAAIPGKWDEPAMTEEIASQQPCIRMARHILEKDSW